MPVNMGAAGVCLSAQGVTVSCTHSDDEASCRCIAPVLLGPALLALHYPCIAPPALLGPSLLAFALPLALE
eukprot:scaffold136048_cov26-Tisochrysis_lutea.AAC.2